MSDLHVVGVHGIRQRDTNALKLTEDWNLALAEGVSLHCGPTSPTLSVITPYYGDVFPKGRFQLGDDDPSEGSAETDEEQLELLAQALEAHTPPVPGERPAAGTLGAPPRVSPRITAALARIDRRCGPGVGKALLTRVSEVYGYFSAKSKHDGMADTVRDRVSEAVEQSRATLIIAHSLGSVIVYDMFRRGRFPSGADDSVSMLITCGSPLAWLPLRRELGLRASDELQLPPGVRWLNVFDPRDPVTAGVGLFGIAPGVTDVAVDNDDDPHAASRYLEQQPVAAAVHGHMTRGPLHPGT
ncbi:hypothetical protein [Streptomyces rubiginosohelvolus]|uniref:hypothetical protein n=1 Tax=Streptomyces rubiginosohelvolus TaxID=67362 RepID=UPI0035DA0794